MAGANSANGSLDSTRKISNSVIASSAGSGTASITVDASTVTANFFITAPDLTVTSAPFGNSKPATVLPSEFTSLKRSDQAPDQRCRISPGVQQN